MPIEDLEAFLRTIDLDPGARTLVGWCEAQSYNFI